MAYQGVLSVDARMAGSLAVTNLWGIASKHENRYTFPDGSSAYVDSNPAVLYIIPRHAEAGAQSVDIPFTPMLHGYPVTPVSPAASTSASASSNVPAVLSIANWDYPTSVQAPPASAVLVLSLTPLVAEQQMTLKAVVAPVTVTGDLTLRVDASAFNGAATFVRCQVGGADVETTTTAPLDATMTVSLDKSVDGDDADAGFPAMRHINVECAYTLLKTDALLSVVPAVITASLEDKNNAPLAAQTIAASFPRLHPGFSVDHSLYFDKGGLLEAKDMTMFRKTYASALRQSYPALNDDQVRVSSQQMVDVTYDNDKTRLEVVFVIYSRENVHIEPETIRNALSAITHAFLEVGITHSDRSVVTAGTVADEYCAYRCCDLCPAEGACTEDQDCLSGKCQDGQCVEGHRNPSSNVIWYVLAAVFVVTAVAASIMLYRKYGQRCWTRRKYSHGSPLLSEF
jgi:hypothetical protein